MAKSVRNYIFIGGALLSEVVKLSSNGHFFDGFCQFS